MLICHCGGSEILRGLIGSFYKTVIQRCGAPKKCLRHNIITRFSFTMRHCEELCDEAIHWLKCILLDCFSYARNDGIKRFFVFHTQNCIEKKAAFTLAEVLITLGIIGIVAAITLPVLVTNVQERIRAEQIRTVKYKFTKATDKMNSLGLIGPYASTDAFVDELQKHLKIIKRCGVNDMRACWPYDFVDLGDGTTWDISKTKTGKHLKMKSDENNDYSSDNVGIVTADGTPMILNYNKKCSALDESTLYAWSTEDNKPVSNATASCVAAVFEINGTAKPNALRKDVALFNAGGLGSACAIEVDGKCFGAAFSPVPLTYNECMELKGDLGISECCASSTCKSQGDYWAGAVKQCGGVGNMPTAGDLEKIASMIYDGNPGVSGAVNHNLSYTPGTATSLGLPEPGFGLWAAGELNDQNGDARYFAPTRTYYHYCTSDGTTCWNNRYRTSKNWAICIE